MHSHSAKSPKYGDISHWLTPAKPVLSMVEGSLVMFELVVRVPQPPDQSSNAGYREAAANRGRLLVPA